MGHDTLGESLFPCSFGHPGDATGIEGSHVIWNVAAGGWVRTPPDGVPLYLRWTREGPRSVSVSSGRLGRDDP